MSYENQLLKVLTDIRDILDLLTRDAEPSVEDKGQASRRRGRIATEQKSPEGKPKKSLTQNLIAMPAELS